MQLFGIALDAAKRWFEILPSYAKSNPFGLSFPTKRGARRQKDRFLKTWHDHRQTAGIKRNIRWHDLRHTCGSSLVSGWWGRRWTLEEVKEHLGHSSITMTQRYAHLGATAIRAAAAETERAHRQGHAAVTPLRLVVCNPTKSLGTPGKIRTYDIRLRSSNGSAGAADVYALLCPLRDRARRVLETAASASVLERGEAEALAREWLAHVGADDALKIVMGGALPAQLINFCTKLLLIVDALATPSSVEEGGAR